MLIHKNLQKFLGEKVCITWPYNHLVFVISWFSELLCYSKSTHTLSLQKENNYNTNFDKGVFLQKKNFGTSVLKCSLE